MSAKRHNKNAINTFDRKKDKGWKTDAYLVRSGSEWIDSSIRDDTYLIDYRNNKRQFSRRVCVCVCEKPIAMYSLLRKLQWAINTVACAFFCYRPASWMNARWTSESKPSWPRFYWSCRCWHRCATWYSRSVSDVPLQHPLDGKMQRYREKASASCNLNPSLSETLLGNPAFSRLESIINWHVKQIIVINDRSFSHCSSQ